MLQFAAAVGIKGDIIERSPQALRAIFYLLEAVHRRPHGVCATHGCSRSPGVDAERPRSSRGAHASA